MGELLCLSPGDLLNTKIKPMSPVLQADSFLKRIQVSK